MRCYGEMMADAAADGYESPESAAMARYQARMDARAEDKRYEDDEEDEE